MPPNARNIRFDMQLHIKVVIQSVPGPKSVIVMISYLWIRTPSREPRRRPQ